MYPGQFSDTRYSHHILYSGKIRMARTREKVKKGKHRVSLSSAEIRLELDHWITT
jgi:hypothetical protein